MSDPQEMSGTVLIVDDDSAILEYLHETLTREGYHCDEAASGDVAAEMLGNRQFDLLITDIVMPGMGGLELAAQARRLSPSMLIIVMTGYINEFPYDKAIASGASDFIKKPFTPVELLVRIKHVRQQERLRVMAVTDELTGLLNRRGFFSLAEQQMKMARRKNSRVYMVYIDIDNMKEINDRLGHQAGDAALTDAACMLKATFRDSDIIGRVGGDEFVVIPVESEETSLEGITARLCKKLEHHNFTTQREYALSLSFGISYYDPADDDSLDNLLMRADKRMLEQKVLKRKQ
ncbi:MAG TPA: diguanylate cyclase [Thermodesulfovibrionales bacterium]|nr:diguanylate cyclase [Thermodesulfovibrionales bacterium]